MIPIAKPFLTSEEAQSAHDTILSGWITQGPKVAEFEQKFASYTGAQYAVALSNCTTALHLSMIVAGIGCGDEVICPSMSYIATSNSIMHVGAKPIFAEVNDDYNIDIDDVKKKINKNTKAILIVHQIGTPANIDDFSKLCKEKKLILIEDAACAIGSSYKGKKIGSHSDLVCFSFHPRKVITTGDGGMITTSRKDFAERLKLLRQHGMSVNDQIRHMSKNVIIEEYLEVGYNYRMTDIQASVGIKQLEKLDWIVEERRKIANKYIEGLKDIECIQLPYEEDGKYINFQSFPIYLKENCKIERNDLMQQLLDKGISTRRGIMTAHREKVYNSTHYHLPKSENLSDRSLLIPLYVPMSIQEIEFIIDNIIYFLRNE
jgi:perosamine synthetase